VIPPGVGTSEGGVGRGTSDSSQLNCLG
jgi:hypothetical protein